MLLHPAVCTAQKDLHYSPWYTRIEVGSTISKTKRQADAQVACKNFLMRRSNSALTSSGIVAKNIRNITTLSYWINTL